MIKYEDVYKSLLSYMVNKNYSDLNITLDEENMEKIKSWCERHSVPLGIAKYNFYTNEIFRYEFIKDPKKQNLASIAFIEFIEHIYGKNSVKVLPNGGKNALYVHGGMIISYNDGKSVHKMAKTIDFIMQDSHGRNIYISHKRTDGASGGAQSNQLKDVESFLLESIFNNDSNKIFIAVLDGDYYLDKMKSLKERYDKEGKIYVCNSDMLVNDILVKLNG